MATLYKRYIPPNSTTNTVTIPPVTQIVKPPAQVDAPEVKRKRERSQEEIEARKAKKLKKKGLDTDLIPLDSVKTPLVDTTNSHRLESSPKPIEQTSGQPNARLPDDFSHVKSAKKRHKLEKEARKVRKAAERVFKESDNNQEDEREAVSYESAHTTEHNQVHHKGSAALTQDGRNNIGSPALADGIRDVHKSGMFTTELNGAQSPLVSEAVGPKSTVQSEEASRQPLKAKTGPKERRHRLEEVLNRGEDGTEPQTTRDENMRKHTGVLDKFQKSVKKSQASADHIAIDSVRTVTDDLPVVKNLSLPEVDDEQQPSFSGHAILPAWLAAPEYVSFDNAMTFGEMGLDDSVVKTLSDLDLHEALPVQQAVIPLLLPPEIPGSKHLPGTQDLLPDIAVNSHTGSGKTIAYLVPIFESLRAAVQIGQKKTRALIVVPTQELVRQVALVATSLAATMHLTVGTATGSEKLLVEQRQLVTRSWRYDPQGFAQNEKNAHFLERAYHETWQKNSLQDLDRSMTDAKASKVGEDALDAPPAHVLDYHSTVDILVATPGRLVEHMNTTLGFSLNHLEWLVIDEADKMLDNQSEAFLHSINAEILRERDVREQDAREQFLRRHAIWNEHRERRIRKVVLSATMTKDVSKLAILGLKYPRLIVMRDAKTEVHTNDLEHVNPQRLEAIEETGDDFELPQRLVEYCIPVGDGSEKPLVAIELLRSNILAPFGVEEADGMVAKSKKPSVDEDTSDTDSSSEESSILSDDSSSVLSDSSIEGTSSDDNSVASSEESEGTHQREDKMAFPVLSGTSSRHIPSTDSTRPQNRAYHAPTVLMFTSSNESATRFAHLLKQLKPQWAPWISTLTKPNAGKERQMSARLDQPVLVISTDRAARGLDRLYDRPITHVLQYDIPRSVTSYIHRVGRTARAGRTGEAWTFYTHSEARWFVNEITKAQAIKRVREVERVKIFMGDEKLRSKYREVLSAMKAEVLKGHA